MSLNQLALYKKSNPDINDAFMNNMHSKLNVHIDIKRNETNTEEWIEQILSAGPHILKALQSPTKQIITEEEVVKIELVKKVTVETIKHLAKNTNLITDIDEETGDVRPKKLLNTHKEEDYFTYENKFMYTLVTMIQDFVDFKKKKVFVDEPEKNLRKISYEGKTKIDQERVCIKSEISVDKSEDVEIEEERVKNIKEQLAQIDMYLRQFKGTELYKTIDKKKDKGAKISPPLKMTNPLLKNVHYQYAVKLWNYLYENFSKELKRPYKEKKDYEDKTILTTLYDETFLLDYLSFDLIKLRERNEDISQIDTKRYIKKITENLIIKILELNQGMTEAQLREMLAENYIKVRNKYNANIEQIEKIYSKNIKQFMVNMSK